jgi:hypothetical protein
VKKSAEAVHPKGWADWKNFRAPPLILKHCALTQLNHIGLSKATVTLRLKERILKFWKSGRPFGREMSKLIFSHLQGGIIMGRNK